MLEIPFYISEGRRCAQAALRSVLEYRGIRLNYEELDLALDSDSQNSISMFQIANVLNDLRVKFNYPVRPFFQNEGFEVVVEGIRRDYCERISRLFNLDSLKKSFDNIRLNGLFEVREQRPCLEEIARFVEENRAVICMISYDKMAGRERTLLKQNGHYLVLTGVHDKFVYAHDSGPQGAMPNRPIRRDKFLASWDFSFFDWDIIII